MFVILPVVLVIPATLGYCNSSVSVNLLDGCAFNSLMAFVEKSGWVLSKENCGQSVVAESFEVPPVVYYDFAEPDRVYTLIFIDLDGSPEENKVFLLWAVINIPVRFYVNRR